MTTPLFNLPEWEQDQNQPHVTINTALRMIECLAQLSVIDRSLSSPPADPDEGDCYIVSGSATGDWAGFEEDSIAMYVGGGWRSVMPKDGWEGWIQDENIRARYTEGTITGWNAV